MLRNKDKVEKNYARRYANEYHLLRILLQVFAVFVMAYPFLKLIYRIKVEGRENLPDGSRFIYAGNHVSMFDPLLVSYAVLKPIAYLAKKELFEQPKLQWWIKKLGSISVDREKPQSATFKSVKEVFNTSWSLGIFPQGGIKDNKKIEDIKRGFVHIAKVAKADIVPVAIVGFEGYTKKLFSQNLKIKIGIPISYNLSDDEIIQEWVRQICEATGFENCMIDQCEETPEYAEAQG